MRAAVVRDELTVMVMEGGDGDSRGGSSVALTAKTWFSPCAHILPLTKTALLRKIGAFNPCECTLLLCRTSPYNHCMDSINCTVHSTVPPRLRQYSAHYDVQQQSINSPSTVHQPSIDTPLPLRNVARHDTRLIQASPRPRRAIEANPGNPMQTLTSLIFDDIPNVSIIWSTRCIVLNTYPNTSHRDISLHTDRELGRAADREQIEDTNPTNPLPSLAVLSTAPLRLGETLGHHGETSRNKDWRDRSTVHQSPSPSLSR